MPAIEMNHTGKTAKNQPSSWRHPTAVQSTSERVACSARKCSTIVPQPPTSIRPMGTATKTIPIKSTSIWKTSVWITALRPPIVV